MKRPKKSVAFSGVLALTVALLLLICIFPAPKYDKAIWVAIIAIGWIFAGAGWIIQRFGKVGGVAVGGCLALIAGSAIYFYVQDEPNRQLVERVKDLGARNVEAGRFPTTIWVVQFGKDATDDQVKQFTELEGLDELEKLFFDGTKLTDATAERLTRFSELKVLSIDGSKLKTDTILHLHNKMPKCLLMVNGDLYHPSPEFR